MKSPFSDRALSAKKLCYQTSKANRHTSATTARFEDGEELAKEEPRDVLRGDPKRCFKRHMSHRKMGMGIFLYASSARGGTKNRRSTGGLATRGGIPFSVNFLWIILAVCMGLTDAGKCIFEA